MKFIISTLLYNFFIQLYQFGIFVFSFFNPKAKAWIEGRKKDLPNLSHTKGTTIWIHCASLGEFEQGRPLIEALKTKEKTLQIVLSFFSPSGFETRKNYTYADVVCYLPMDSPENAKTFIQKYKPNLALFIKYEFWYHYLDQLQKQSIPTLLISASFRPNQVFFKWYGSFFKVMLKKFDHLFVQDHRSVKLLQGIGINQVNKAGDTRVDRVFNIVKTARSIPTIQSFRNGNALLIAGSTWPKDETLLCALINNHLPLNWKVIIAPHQIQEPHLIALEKILELPYIRFSKLEQKRSFNSSNHRVLIIDNIGMLSSIYQYGKIAYIGGGFGTGIHNLLEPIAHRLPVIFGPNYHKFMEAKKLIETSGGFSIKSELELIHIFQKLSSEEFYQQASKQASAYIESNRGATKVIVEFLEQEYSNLFFNDSQNN